MTRNITFQLDARESRAVLAAAQRRGLALATVARALLLRYLGVKPSPRQKTGPNAIKMRDWRLRQTRGRR